uniref:ZrgA family zinc uptake protein n=1 Tax=Neptunomonas sp. TaxID=1971898 RepID=UPI0035637724
MKICKKTRVKDRSQCATSVLVTALSSFMLTSLVHAGEAHEHGVVTIDAVVEEKLLDVMLITPAVNVVGFEHTPETEAQKAEVLQAINSLKQGYQIIQLPRAALCLLKEADVTQSLLESQHEHEEEHAHAHEEEHEHEEKHAHEHEEEDGHADIRVHYQFVCAKPEQLTQITVGLFDQFPVVESVRYQMVSQAGQTGGTL